MQECFIDCASGPLTNGSVDILEKTAVMPDHKNKFIFVIGGRRSGKSSYALNLGESLGDKKLFIATAQALDKEMEERIAKHRAERGNGWETMEVPVNISAAVKTASRYDVVLIDCLTLWLSNLMHEGNPKEKDIIEKIDALVTTGTKSKPVTILISNEIGLGIIPDNPLARKFSDLAGIMNQKVAAAADMVVMTLSGIPTTIKRNK